MKFIINTANKPLILVTAATILSLFSQMDKGMAQSLTAENIQSTPIPWNGRSNQHPEGNVPVTKSVPPPTLVPAVVPKSVIPVPPTVGFPGYSEKDLWLFKPGEFYIEGFAIGDTTRNNNFGDTAGAGGALGYYFSRHFGVMLEGFSANLPGGTVIVHNTGRHAPPAHPYLEQQSKQSTMASAGLQARIPFDDSCFALYAFALGGGYFGDNTGGTLSAGLGIDVRLTEHTSLFFDARAVKVSNQHLGTRGDQLGISPHQKPVTEDRRIFNSYQNATTPGLSPKTDNLRELDQSVLMRIGLRWLF